METTRLLRVLSLLSFLLLMAPFYDACDRTNGGLFVATYNECDMNGKPIQKTFYQNVYNTIVDELSNNGFELARFPVIIIQDITLKEFKKELVKEFQKKDWYKNLGFFVCVFFDFIVLISFLILGLSFLNKYKFFRILALTNCILIIITYLYIVFFDISFNHFYQIKWGFYAFILTNLLIFYFSKRQLRESNSLI